MPRYRVGLQRSTHTIYQTEIEAADEDAAVDTMFRLSEEGRLDDSYVVDRITLDVNADAELIEEKVYDAQDS
jgi:hypothetical protein